MFKEISINEIYVRRYDNRKRDFVKNCPYYTSLVEKSPEIFTNYVKISKYQSCKKSGKWRNFYNIYRNIKKYGYDFNVKDKIIIKYLNGKFQCKHGKHRICMLYKIYGNKLTLVLENNKLVSIK